MLSKRSGMFLMSLYCSHDWLSLPYNALDISKTLLKGVLQFCALKAAIKQVILKTRYYLVHFRTSNSLYLSTPCSQQLKALGMLFLSSFWLLSHNVMTSQCCPLLVIRVTVDLLRDISIFSCGCTSVGSFKHATVIKSIFVLILFFH